MPELLSQRAYGKRRGVSHTAVQRAIADGRLVRSVHLHPDGKREGRFKGIDPQLADKEWAELTDPTKPTGKVPEPDQEPEKPTGLLPGIEPDAPAAAKPGTLNDPETLSARKRGITATSVKSIWTARLAELEYKEKAGQLVDSEEVYARYFEAFRTLRDLILAVPSRLGAILAAETAESVCRTLLEDELRATLAAVADNLKKKPEDASSEPQ